MTKPHQHRRARTPPGVVERWSHASARWAASPGAILLATALLIVTGWALDWSRDWASVAGLVATFATLLLMFVLQRAQNKDFRAVHIKLDELVAAIEGARPHFIHAEDRTEAELERLRKMVEPAVDPEASSSTSSGSLDPAR